MEKDNKYKYLIESIDAIAWEYDIASDTWVYVSPKVEEILGYKPSDFKGLKFWADNIYEGDKSYATSYCQKATEEGRNHTFEYRFKKKDGSYIWLRDIVTVDVVDAKPVKIHGFMVDISNIKKTEEEMKNSIQELERFTKLVVDREEKMIELKKEIERLKKK